MEFVGFCGPSNPSQSVIADCERLRNWYVERVESPAAPTGAALYPTPGLQAFASPSGSGVRGAWAMNGRCFFIVGTNIVEVFQTGAYTVRGTVAEDDRPATISYNRLAASGGGALFITSGDKGYHYHLGTNVLTTVLTSGATMGGMINSRFLSFNLTNGQVRMSALNDGTTWDPTLYFDRTQAPDPWQMMIVNPPEIWMIGEQTGEVWYDSGAFPQPFAPIPGAFFKTGALAPFAGGIAGDTVTWLARTAGGGAKIVAAKGYTPEAISNFAVDTALAAYLREDGVAAAELLSYEDHGHLFAVFNFPASKNSWAFDFTGGLWHERSSRNATTAVEDVWFPRVHAAAFGKHLIGGRNVATIAEMDVTFGSELNGAPIRRVRVAPPLWAAPGGRLIIDRLDLKVEPGLGVASGQGSDPTVMLRTSMDAKTWGKERHASAGAMGQYGTNVYWLMVGSSNDLWVPEIVVTDPIPWRISGAEIQGRGLRQMARGAA